MMKMFLLLFAVLIQGELMAKSLSEYRSEFSLMPISLQTKAAVNDVHLIQEASALKFAGASVRQNHLSSFVRQNLIDRAREFMMRDLYDTPQVFTPSSTISMEQVQENIRKKTDTFCHEKIAPNFEVLLKRYAEQKDDLVDSKTLVVSLSDEEKKVRTLLSAHIQTQHLSIGSLTSIEIENETLSRLIFTNTKHEVVKIGLPTLVSARIGEDYYYVQMLSCFDSLLSASLGDLQKNIDDGKSNDFAKRDLLKSVSSDFHGRLEGANLTYKVLSSMSEKDLDSLIEVFDVFNQSAYPSIEEWDALKMKMIEKMSTSSENPSLVSALNADLNFFQENLDALYRLENFRQESKQRQEIQKEKP